MKLSPFLLFAATRALLSDELDAGDDDSLRPNLDNLGFPCPSTECWTYDEGAGTCSLIDDEVCTKVTCAAEEMIMEVGDNVFADSADSMPFVEPALAETETGRYGAALALDSGDVTHEVVGDKLVFTVQFSLKGKERGRSDVEDNILDLGNGILVNTAPFGIGVTFQCSYDMTVDLTSSQFSVQEVTVSGTKSGDGTLEEGFEMELNDGDSSALVLGSRLSVQTTWKLTLSDIDFYYKGCSVRHDTGDEDTDDAATKVAVVRDGCYSDALKATRDDCDDGVCFSFQTFTIEEQTGTNQVIGCTIQLCNSAETDGCVGKTDPTCPDDASGYAYSPDGQA